MASQVRVCSERPTEPPGRWAESVCRAITSTSTVQGFEDACSRFGGFRQNDISGKLSILFTAAAFQTNFQVVDHILRSRGTAGLNRGDKGGETLLFSVITFPGLRLPGVFEEKRYRTVEVLLQHGADPNLATLGGVTPLWAAVEKTRDVALAQLLLVHGAQLGSGTLSSDGQKVLANAQTGLAAYRRGICEALDGSLLPPLAGMVADYAGAPPCSMQIQD